MNYKVRDTIKSSIFLIPLFIISSTYFFELVIRCNKSRIIFSTLILSIYILFLINSIISNEYGGIYIFGFERVLTLSDLFIFYILFIFILIFFSNKNHRKLSQFKIFNSKYLKTKILKNKLKSLNLKNKKYNFLIIFLVILILFNNFIINFRFLNNSYYFSDDQGLEDFAETLEDYAPLNTIIFGNNYVNMKTFLSDDFIKNTNFVPFPHTEKEFYDYMQNPSINSCFYITNERESTWTDSSNQYIKNYINRDIITSNNKKNLNITEFNLPSPLVKYKFENNGSIIKDLSGYGNDGIPNNISIIDGLSNKSAYFEEELKSYITLNNSNFFNFDQNLSISFTANISSRYGIILSKGNEEYSGSFQINLWNSSLYFNINEVGRIWVENGEMEQLFNSWHQYIFNYNGYIMQIIIDGSIKSEKLVNGKINETDYFINISGDRNRDCCYITGYIDDFQITNHSIEVNKLIELFNKSCYSVFINNKVYYLNEDHTEIVKFYKNINYPQKVNATSLNSEINELNCYAEAKDFFLEFNINSLKESFITILICTKFFTRVINYETNIGINRFNYTISSVGNLHDYSSDKYIFTKLYRFQLIIIENNEIIYNNLVTVQDNYYVLICFLILLLFIFLIALTSYSNLPNLIVKKITKKYTRS